MNSEPDDAITDDDYDPPTYALLMTKSGEINEFDISYTACKQYGFFYGQRVYTPKGTGSVIGVYDGFFWFHLDCDRGCSYWDTVINYEGVLALNITALEHDDLRTHEEGLMIRNTIKTLNQFEKIGVATVPLFAVSKAWWEKWRLFVAQQGPYPGPVDNYSLLDIARLVPTLVDLCIDYLTLKNHPFNIQELPAELMQKINELRHEGGLAYKYRPKRVSKKTMKEQLVLFRDFVIMQEPHWRRVVGKYKGGPSLPLQTSVRIPQ